jgi:hypothetical protein
MKLVKVDEVFMKLKEISNPGHPHDSCKCGCGGRGEYQHTCKGCGGKVNSSIICPKCPKVVDHEEDYCLLL